MTLNEAKTELRKNWKEGAECPCCTQFVKLYRRTITSSMAAWLIEFFHADLDGDPEGWIKVSARDWKYMKGGDYAKLRHWGLIEAHPDNQEAGAPDRKSAGYWRITMHGRDFVRGRCAVRQHVHIFADRRIESGAGGNPVLIWECLRNRFSYNDLMGAATDPLVRERYGGHPEFLRGLQYLVSVLRDPGE